MIRKQFLKIITMNLNRSLKQSLKTGVKSKYEKVLCIYMIAALIFSLFSATSIHAQDNIPENVPPKMREKIKELMVWKLTDRLNLSTEQGEKFFPLLNKFLDANDKLMQERRELVVDISKNLSILSDSKLDEKSSRILEIDRERAENMIRLSKDSEKILTPKQKADLIIFQTEFVRDLAKMVEKRRKDRKKR